MKTRRILLLAAAVFCICRMQAQTVVDSVPYNCDFENVTEQAYWRFCNDDTNRWFIGNATSNGGTNALYISDSNGATNTMSATATFSYAIRTIYMTAGLYDVSYDWKANGYSSSANAYMRVFLIPANVAFTGGSLYAGLSATSLPANAISLDGNAALCQRPSWRTFRDAAVQVPSTQNYQLVFFWYNSALRNNERSLPPAAIDNISMTPVQCPQPLNLTVADLGNGCVELDWGTYGNAPQGGWEIEYGNVGFVSGTGQVVHAATNPDTICGLPVNQTIQFHVRALCDSVSTSTPAEATVRLCGQFIGGIDVADLTAQSVTCTYGTYTNYGSYSVSYPGPYSNVGIIDYGQYAYGLNRSLGSRHTVNTDLTLYDPFSRGVLPVIPQGECSSVRLGCAYGSFICQAIAYEFQADSTVADMISFQYSVVIYDPAGHPVSQKPRFIMEILDSNDNSLSTVVDFASNQAATLADQPNSTWHSASEDFTYWKEWTPVSVLLAPYHGQRIKIRFTTFACGQGASTHFGYAYIAGGQCSHFALLEDSTSVDKRNDITFSAPRGFSYSWYLTSQPNDVIDTTMTATIPYGSNFACKIEDIFGNSKEFRSIAKERVPQANFTATVASPTCHSRVISLHNNSTLTIDSMVYNETGQTVWFIDDDGISYARNPSFEATPGNHTVKLIVSTGLGISDTMTQTVTVADYGYVVEEIFDTVLSGQGYGFAGQTLTESGIYQDTVAGTGGDCDTIKTLHLTVKGGDGIETAHMRNLSVYPNPTTGMVYLSSEVDRVEVMDFTGRIVSSVEKTSKLDIKKLPAGVYVFRISTADGVLMSRMVKK